MPWEMCHSQARLPIRRNPLRNMTRCCIVQLGKNVCFGWSWRSSAMRFGKRSSNVLLAFNLAIAPLNEYFDLLWEPIAFQTQLSIAWCTVHARFRATIRANHCGVARTSECATNPNILCTLILIAAMPYCDVISMLHTFMFITWYLQINITTK